MADNANTDTSPKPGPSGVQDPDFELSRQPGDPQPERPPEARKNGSVDTVSEGDASNPHVHMGTEIVTPPADTPEVDGSAAAPTPTPAATAPAQEPQVDPMPAVDPQAPAPRTPVPDLSSGETPAASSLADGEGPLPSAPPASTAAPQPLNAAAPTPPGDPAPPQPTPVAAATAAPPADPASPAAGASDTADDASGAALTELALQGAAVAENDPGAAIGTLTTDLPADTPVTFTVSDDRFEVVDGALKLKDGVSLDHEAAASVAVEVTATDAAGQAVSERFEIAVGDVDEAPTALSLSGTAVAENAPGAVIGTLSVNDPDAGATHGYTVSDDRFEVVDGALKLKDGISLDHEAAEAVAVEVTATDAAGQAVSERFEIAVGDVDEAPHGLTFTPDSGDDPRVLGTLEGADVDSAGLTYQLVDAEGSPLAAHPTFAIDGDRLVIKPGADLSAAAGAPVHVAAVDASGGTFVAPLSVDVSALVQDAVRFTFSQESDDRGVSQDRGDAYTIDLDHAQTRTVDGAEMDVRGIGDAAAVTASMDSDGAAEASVDSGWNSVKNVHAEADGAADVRLDGFVDTQVALGDGDDSRVEIDGAKRGRIVTGDGDDSVAIDAQSNGQGWSNRFEVATGAGDDTVTIQGDRGLTQADVDAGAGDDSVTFDGSGPATLAGGAGDDTLRGGGGDDTLQGGTGDDVLLGGAGDDRLHGRSGADSLQGGAGDDFIVGNRGDDAAVGGAGRDWLQMGSGDDAATGQGGNDVLLGGGGADFLVGGDGDDRIDGDRLWGNTWTTDVAWTEGGADTLFGGAGNDTLAGGEGDDTLFGGADDDTLSGDTGDDRLAGGDGDDVLTGGTGSDRLSGGAGDDVLRAGTGDPSAPIAIDSANVLATDQGFRVTGQSAGPDGLSAASADNLTLAGSRGFGVRGTSGGADHQLGYNAEAGLSERVTVEFDGPVESAQVQVTRLFAREGADGETGVWRAFADGEEVASGSFTADRGHKAQVGIEPGQPFDTLTFEGTDLTEPGADASEYYIQRIEAQPVSDAGSVNVLDGGAGDDTLIGGTGDDLLVAGSGDDVLHGGAGDDWIELGDHSDRNSVSFDGGNDTMTGFDVDGGGESSFDTLTIETGDLHATLASGTQILEFVAAIESDGAGETDALVHDGNLTFVTAREGADGTPLDSVTLQGVVGSDGLTESALRAAGADFEAPFGDTQAEAGDAQGDAGAGAAAGGFSVPNGLEIEAFQLPANPEAAWTEAIAEAAPPADAHAHQAWTDALEGDPGGGNGEAPLDLAQEPVANMPSVEGAEVTFEGLNQPEN